MKPNNRVIFYIHSHVHLLDLAGAVQAFYEAGDCGQPYDIVFVSAGRKPVVSSAGLSFGRLEDYSTVEAGPSDLLIVAGFESRTFEVPIDASLVAWLRRAAHANAIVCSVCTGAFLLAEAGLLDDRECTTHWKLTSRLQKEYPRLCVKTDRLFVRDGNIYTSAGVTTGLDMALFLLEERHGPEFAYQVARELVVYIRRDGSESQESIYLQYRAHINNGIHVVQDWMMQNVQRKVKIEDHAELIHTSPRNLTRLFKASTGITVGQYLEKLRVEKAMNLLHQGTKIGTVTRQCGFQSANQLRQLLKKHKGRLPSELAVV